MAYPKVILSADQIQRIRDSALKAIAPLKPPDQAARIAFGKRTKAGQKLPPYYLVYFLLVDLLNFGHGGRWEKVAWTIPVDYEGKLALVEHRKFGLGVFSAATPDDELAAEGIVRAVERGVKAATPFFDHLAAKAIEGSRLNVNNNSAWLFCRYEYLRDQFRERVAAEEARKNEVQKVEEMLPNGTKITHYSVIKFVIRREAAWLGIAAIDAFFSWTEHALIHIAILRGKLKTGDEVASLAAADWTEKIKTAIGFADPEFKSLYDELLAVRRQVRNYMAHGAFGKSGEAFRFHSGAGAVPVNLTDLQGRDNFSMESGPSFDEAAAIETAESFIEKLWEGSLAPAKVLIQEASLPIILTHANDGTYQRAMRSVEEMESFVEAETRAMDNAVNMDW
ncbi:MAG: hypothetical protein WA485_00900 [Candidatus Sulfotelmatobacter sp.]